jgi:hypothetical protein
MIAHGVGVRCLWEPPDAIESEEDTPGSDHREDAWPGLAMPTQMESGNDQGEQQQASQERFQVAVVDQETRP